MIDIIHNLVLSVHGAGGGHGGGVAGTVEQLLIFLVSLTEKTPQEVFAAIMPGIAAMENIHPLFVHFPIALLVMFFLIDFAGSVGNKPEWRKVAGWFLYIGVVMAAATVAAGLQAEESVAHGGNVHEIMERHETLGLTVLGLAAVLAVWRLLSRGRVTGVANVFYLLTACALNIILVFAADLGGLMVYKYGVSVEASRSIQQQYYQQHSHGDGGYDHGGHQHSH